MQILITGSSGLIGSSLIPYLAGQGHQVIRLIRSSPKPSEPEVRWDPAGGVIDPAGLEGAEAVIHLAGDPIAAGRWTPEKKARIRESRVNGTRLLCESLSRLSQPPKVIACASAIGYYGNRGDEILTEESSPGTGFLAETGVEWEKAAEPARRRGIRVVHLRFGIVLSPKGGALAMMLPPFRMGLGGVLGNGRQIMSWVSLEDVLGAAVHALTHDSLSGPVNVTTPRPVTNREFTKALGKVLRRPTIFPVPAFAVRAMFGELADEALLAGARVQPSRLLATGYRFRHPDIEAALQELLTSGDAP